MEDVGLAEVEDEVQEVAVGEDFQAAVEVADLLEVEEGALEREEVAAVGEEEAGQALAEDVSSLCTIRSAYFYDMYHLNKTTVSQKQVTL
jgi:hypothetical protein